MKFLAMSRRLPGVTDQQVAADAEAEALAAFRLVRSGTFDQMYFSGDWRGAVLIVQSASRETAQAALASLPMVAHGLIGFDLYQLDPYDHFARLFRDEHRDVL